MKTVEFGIIIERAQGPRLQAAERLLGWFARLFQESLVGCDIAWCESTHTIVAFLRFAQARFTLDDHQRLQFWSARSGGRARFVGELTKDDATLIQETIDLGETRAIGLTPEGMERAVVDLCTAAGLDPKRREYADERPVLAIDVCGPRWSAVRWNNDEETLFLASPFAPPLGDAVPVIVRVPGWARPAVEWARVADRTAPEDAAPGHPAGYSLSFDTAPTELRAALSRNAPVVSYGSRAAPRFQLAVPIRAVLAPAPLPASGTDSVSLADEPVGKVENISLGGAFVRIAPSPPVGTELKVRFRLPTGVIFDSKCVVAFSDMNGVGIRFVLDSVGMAGLHEALTHLSANPRRALVIDDDALARQMVADALVERGFEVLTASDAREGLHLLAEDVLAIDLLVTDMILPGVDGAELVATIRRAGGESDLVIAVMTGRPDAELARRLQEAGADLLLGKALGAEVMALKADELLEAKRRERGLSKEERAEFAPMAPRGSMSAHL
jgi:CheY-like chemotaxis protein